MTSRRKNITFAFIGVAIMAILGFALLETVLRLTATSRGNATFLLGKRWYYLTPIGIPQSMPDIVPTPGAYRVYDPYLGWSMPPLGRGDDPNRVGKTDPEIYFSDENGYRCDLATHEKAVEQNANTPQTTEAPRKLFGFVCIGDSFTHGDAVKSADTWPSCLAQASGQTVANLGVGGYGIDQAVMRYEKSNPSCNHVLLGLIAGDLERSTHLIYNLSYGDTKSKPIFEFSEHGVASVFNRPALHGDALLTEYTKGSASEFFPRAKLSWDPRLLSRSPFDISYCYRTLKSIPAWRADRAQKSIYQTDGDSLTYCVRILQHLKELTENRNAKLTVVILGETNSFSHRANRQEDPWRLFKSKLDAAGINSIDTTPDIYRMFTEARSSVINAWDRIHYSPEANSKVAEIVNQALRN